MKRPGDKTPEPLGGRAAERLRLFENARRAPGTPDSTAAPDELIRKRATPAKAKTPRAAAKKRRRRREKQDRPQK